MTKIIQFSLNLLPNPFLLNPECPKIHGGWGLPWTPLKKCFTDHLVRFREKGPWKRNRKMGKIRKGKEEREEGMGNLLRWLRCPCWSHLSFIHTYS